MNLTGGMGRIASYILIFISSFLFTCRNGTTEPPAGGSTQGKRNYIWTTDSINYGTQPSKIQLGVIWGISSIDLWGVAGDAPDVRDCLWHYNGVNWTRATSGTPITEFTGNKVVYDVWGSASNDVWAVGRNLTGTSLGAFIMHFDGNRWLDASPSNISSIPTTLYDIYGVQKNDIWLGGYEYAMHFDGVSWSAFKVADSLTINGIAGRDKTILFHLASPWGKQEVFLYQLGPIDSAFSIVDHTTLAEDKFGGWPWILGDRIYSITDGIISTGLNDQGQLDTTGWRRQFTTDTYFTQKYVHDSHNIFAVGQWNLVYHFNGDDWKRINISVPNHSVDPYSLFEGVWSDGNEVFICDVKNGVIYHGR